jgi:hypothetical protein
MTSSKSDALVRGLIAGLAATLVLSLLLLLKQGIGLMPGLNLVLILAHALGYQSAWAGWVAHFVVGVLLWGTLFPWFDRALRIDRALPFPHWFNGLMFVSVVWWGVMLVIMPVAGAGLFGLKLGIATPTVTLILHWAYGGVLGIVYGALQPGVLNRNAWSWLPHRAHA